jgi:hypothetical protein
MGCISGRACRRRRRRCAVGDRLGLGAAIFSELGPDANEGRERPIIVRREPDHVLLGFRVRLRRVLGEAVEWHQAAVISLLLMKAGMRCRPYSMGPVCVCRRRRCFLLQSQSWYGQSLNCDNRHWSSNCCGFSTVFSRNRFLALGFSSYSGW